MFTFTFTPCSYVVGLSCLLWQLESLQHHYSDMAFHMPSKSQDRIPVLKAREMDSPYIGHLHSAGMTFDEARLYIFQQL